MQQFLIIIFLRLCLFAAGCAVLGTVSYFGIGYLMYVVGHSDAERSGPGFMKAIGLLTLTGGVLANLMMGSLGERRSRDDD